MYKNCENEYKYKKHFYIYNMYKKWSLLTMHPSKREFLIIQLRKTSQPMAHNGWRSNPQSHSDNTSPFKSIL